MQKSNIPYAFVQKLLNRRLNPSKLIEIIKEHYDVDFVGEHEPEVHDGLFEGIVDAEDFIDKLYELGYIVSLKGETDV